jgi:hypothetical protein
MSFALTEQQSTKQQYVLQEVYNTYFSELRIIVPYFVPTREYFTLYIPKELNCNRIYEMWPFCKHSRHGGAIDQNLLHGSDYDSKLVSYLTSFDQTIEPDNAYIGRSAAYSDPDGNLGIKLVEAMLLELVYNAHTGKHLNQAGITICSGSRYKNSLIPTIYYADSHSVGIGGFLPDDCGTGEGIRLRRETV